MAKGREKWRSSEMDVLPRALYTYTDVREEWKEREDFSSRIGKSKNRKRGTSYRAVIYK